MRFVLPVIFLLLCATASLAAEYVEQEEFKGWLQQGKQVLIVDIQPAEQYRAHHFRNSISTEAFPAKSDDEKNRLDRTLPQITASSAAVVIVCPRGKGGAKNTFEYLASKGIPEGRMFILEEGISGWPWREMLIAGEK